LDFVQTNSPWKDIQLPTEERQPPDPFTKNVIAPGKKKPAEDAQTGRFDNWLPILEAYRTVCIVPSREARAVFDAYRDLRAAVESETGHP
jgi:hypothetical protein